MKRLDATTPRLAVQFRQEKFLVVGLSKKKKDYFSAGYPRSEVHGD